MRAHRIQSQAVRDRRLIRFFVFSAVVLLSAAVLPASAQSGKITAVKVSGSQRFASEQIAAMSRLKAGDTVTKEDLQAAADGLAQLGPFVNVRFHFQSRGEEVEVEFQLEDAAALSVSFDNFPWFTDQELSEAVRQVVPFYDGTAPEQGTVLDLMKGALDTMLTKRNVKAVVEYSPLGRPDGGGMMMQFRVVGTSLRVGAVEFSEALAKDDKRVRQRLDDLVGKAYSRFAVEVFLREQVRPVYMERGHLRVHFGEPEARFTGDPNKPLPDQVTLVVPIEPGPAYNWAGADWEGLAAFGPNALNAVLGLAIGELANGNKIHVAIERVREEFTSRGYLDVQIEAAPAFSEVEAGGVQLHKAQYRISVNEGQQYRMGQIILTGLSLSAERKLLAAWHIPPGEIFNQVQFENFVTQLENKKENVFGDLPVHYDEVGRWLRRNPETKTVDVLLDFK